MAFYFQEHKHIWNNFSYPDISKEAYIPYHQYYLQICFPFLTKNFSNFTISFVFMHTSWFSFQSYLHPLATYDDFLFSETHAFLQQLTSASQLPEIICKRQNFFCSDFSHMLRVKHNTMVSPMLKHWRYHSLVLNHCTKLWNFHVFFGSVSTAVYMKSVCNWIKSPQLCLDNLVFLVFATSGPRQTDQRKKLFLFKHSILVWSAMDVAIYIQICINILFTQTQPSSLYYRLTAMYFI